MALNFRVVSDLNEAESMWRELCPQETVFDSWEYRYSFHVYQKNEIHFIVGELAGELLGVWPLQVGQNSVLEFFGGDYMEDNRLLLAANAEIKYPTVIEDFYTYLKNSNQKIYAQYIKNTDIVSSALPLKDFKYTLPLNTYRRYEDYIAERYEGHGDARRNLTGRLRKLESEHITVQPGKTEDIELLFEFTNRMFGNDSSFISRPFHKEIFRSHLSLPHITPHILTTYHANTIVAVSLALRYNGVYSYVNTGIDPNCPIKNISSFVTIKNIQEAITAGDHLFDAFTGAYGWKDKWYFDATPQRIFEQKV